MTNEEVFDQFRNKLADTVMLKINQGVRVSSSDGDSYCPLGCVAELHKRPPGGLVRKCAGWIAVTPNGAPTAFADGFDGSNFDDKDNTRDYYDLGRAYARRFP